MIFKIYDSDFGVKIDGIGYDFTHVNSLQIEDPEQTRLVRGSNAGNKEGLVYKEGSKDPKKITVTIMNMTPEIKDVLDSAYNDRKRMDVYCVSRADGSGKLAKNSILCQPPQQLTIDENPDSMNVSLIFESFDLTESHKS